jgi:hypothetical protein
VLGKTRLLLVEVDATDVEADRRALRLQVEQGCRAAQ